MEPGIPDPVLTVLDTARQGGANRLHQPGCSLTTAWQAPQPEEGEKPELEVFACEIVLCGDAGALSLVVAEAESDGGAIGAAAQELKLLPGALLSVSAFIDFCLIL